MELSKRTVLAAAIAAAMPCQVYALAISSGSTVNIGNTANAVVQVSETEAAGTFTGTGTIVQIQPYDGGEDLDVLTADHVVRSQTGTLIPAGSVSITFGNTGAGGQTFGVQALATDFTIPTGGTSAVDLAMLDVFIPGSQLNTLPSPLNAVGLPGASPAASTNITQVGYGLQASVTTVSGTLSYVNSTVNSLGSGYGTLLAGPNSLSAAGVTNLTGATSSYGTQKYIYMGFSNGAVINGSAGNSYAGSTSYILSGDSGGPSLSTNGLTILGVHSSSVTADLNGDAPLLNDANAQIAVTNNTSFFWKDVSVADNITWINNELATLSPVPEPAESGLMVVGVIGFLATARTRRRPCRAAMEAPAT